MDDQCVLVKGVKLCGTKKPRFFQKQRLGLCLLHAVNNLIQNNVENVRLFTKREFDRECKKIHDKADDIKCYNDGSYVAEIAAACLDKLGFRNYIYDLNDRSNSYYIEIVNYLLSNIMDNSCIMGLIMVYYDTNGEEREAHAVSVFYQDDKYVIVDSESNLGAYLFNTAEDVVKYFKEENFIWLIYVYHKSVRDFNELKKLK